MRGRKIGFALKTVALWCLTTLYVIMHACEERGERIGLFWVDLKSHFVEDPVLYQMFRNKVILITFFCGALLIIGLLTEEFDWKAKLLGRQICVRAGSKLTRVAYDLVLIVAAVLFGLMVRQYLQPEIVSAFSESWDGDVLIAHAG